MKADSIAVILHTAAARHATMHSTSDLAGSCGGCTCSDSRDTTLMKPHALDALDLKSFGYDLRACVTLVCQLRLAFSAVRLDSLHYELTAAAQAA
jgi:hypothetical protein